MSFPYIIKSISPKEQVIFAINANRDIHYELLRTAFTEVLNIQDDNSRNYFMTQILCGLIAKKSKTSEVTALLDAVFEFDGFQVDKRPYFPGNKIYLTVAGSGKKGLKTINITSFSSFVASSLGVNIVKLCSPSTSSSTGSYDLISILSNNSNWTLVDPVEMVKTLGIGFFPVEQILPKFASVYSGKFFAPHALSFALSGMATQYKTDKMLYGLAHYNTELSVDVFKHYKTPQVMVITSTADGIYYVDEALSIGSTYIEGYVDLESPSKEQGIMYFGDLIGTENKESAIEHIMQKKDPIENVIKGISGLTGINKILEKQFAINAAIMLYITEGGEFIDLYNKCINSIRSGKPLELIKEFIYLSGGDIKFFMSLVEESYKRI